MPAAVRFSSSGTTTTSATASGPVVAIVGTGPSGFYTAKYLIKEDPELRVDLLDALPTPFGA